MKKRILSMILALCMLCTMLPTVALAAEEVASGTCGENVTWVLDDAGTLTISGTGAMEDYVYDDQPWANYYDTITAVVVEDGVTEIGEYAFNLCESITNVTLPESVTSIGYAAFAYCSSLTNVNIPDGVSAIEGETFSSCESLETVMLPVSVTDLGGYAFGDCTSLTSLTIPEAVTSIGSGCFYECAALTSIVIPENVQKLGGEAFFGCSGLTEMVIPASVTKLGNQCFYGCTGLTEMIIPDTVTTVGSGLFNGCTALKSVTLPMGLEEIGEEFFYNCTSLESVIVPAQVMQVANYAFGNCSSLASVTFQYDAPEFLDVAFGGTTTTCYYPAGNETWTEEVMQDYEGSITWTSYEKENLGEGTCGENLTWVLSNDGTFTVSGTGAMTEHDHYSEVPWDYLKPEIQTVVIEEGVTSVGYHAFSDCENMTSVELPDSLERLNGMCLQGPNKLTSVDIPDNVTFIDQFAFSEVSGLTEIELPDGLTELGQGVFFNSGITSITIPKGITIIRDTLFSNCSALEKVWFTGDAPEFMDAFSEVTATVYYPAGNSTWTSDVMLDYGGTLTWSAYCPDGCKYNSVTNRATCTESGDTTYTCSVCGGGYTETIPALGHDYVDGTCSRCGEPEFVITTPTVKAANIKSSGKIRLTWDAVEGAAAYNVYRSTDSGDTFTMVKRTTGTKLNHTSAKAGETYFYYVLAVDEAGNESEFDENKVVHCTGKLQQPTITLSNLASTGKVRIQWEKISGADTYEVYISTDGGQSYSHLGSSNTSKFTHTSAEPGVKYRYKIMATGRNDNGNRATSAYSAAKDRTCDLARPTIRLSAASTGKNKISWNHIDGAVKYEVYRSTDGGEHYSKLSTTARNYIVNTSSEVGKTYRYKVRAIAENTAANSAYSSAKSRTVERPGPEVSIGLTTAGKPKLSWSTISGASKYKVYCSTDGGISFKHLKTVTGTKLTHTSAEAGNIYQYVVKAVIGDETRTSPVVFVPCVHFDISNSKSAKSVVNRINEYREEYDIPTLKWYATGLNAAKVRATEVGEGYTREDESILELLETYNCYLELNFEFEGTSEELIDTIMYGYEEYASYLMYEGFAFAVAARNGKCWVLLFG